MSETTGRPDAARTLTASVLFIDVVESTALRSQLGEERADTFMRDLEERMGEVVTSNQGRVIKGLGDGAMAVFEAAVDAVGAAVALQQQIDLAGRHEEVAVQVRVGISAGDVSIDGVDVRGAPVVEAARLCAAAQPAQVLVADLVRSLSRGRGSFVFEPIGDLPLKGLPEPVPACRVMWEPLVVAGEATEDGMPFPGLLATGGIGYVGRSSVQGLLGAMFDRVLSGEAGMAAALLSGEPGIGKTRTAAELARRAHAGGAIVLYGACDEELGVPFQPFVEALDFYTTYRPSPRLGRLAGELVRLCPEVAARVPALPAPVVSDPRTEEYRLFEAVTSWLIEASGETPIVLVIDDIHWATRGTLLLLAHLLKAAAADSSARLLVVGTYRDTELGRTHPLTAVLADLRRVPGVERLDLQGLTRDETIELVQTVAGHELDAGGRQLAEAAFAETEGNPLFMGEVLRHFVETAKVQLVDGRWQVNDPGQIEVPEGVRDVLGRRLGRLSETANRVLSVASVIGRDFDVELLAAVSDADDNALVDALDEATRARLLEETGQDRFRFFHAMVKETLYGELTSVRRRRLHQTVREALEKLRPYDAAALAYHSVEAGPVGGDLQVAVGHLLNAGAQSAASSDLASAEAYYRQAIDLIDAGDPDPARRIEAVLGLGIAQRDQSDPGFRETLLEATHAALEVGRVDLAAKSAVANFRGFSSVINAVDRERVDALEATIAAYPKERSGQAALLLATLAAEVNYDSTVSEQRRLEIAEQAVDMALEIDDARVLAEVIVRSVRANLVPARVERGLALLTDAVEFADAVQDPTLSTMSRILLQVANQMMGEHAEARRLIVDALEIAQHNCPPLILALCRANWPQYLLYEGRVQEAGAENDATLAFGQQIGVEDAEQWWGTVACSVVYLEGGFADMADMARVFADRYSDAVAWRGAYAWMLAEGGRLEEARQVIEAYCLDRPDLFRVDEVTIPSWSYPAMLAFLLDDADLGAAAEATLRPYEQLWISLQVYCFGPVAWALAVAVAAQGRYDEAHELLERTDAMLVERGIESQRNLVRFDHARVLARSSSPEHRQRAAELARLGAEHAERDGFARVKQQFEDLLDALATG